MLVALAGILAVLFDATNGRPAAALLAGVVGLAAGGAKLSFDALVQRHVPAASQGRAFGRFEAGFQLAWVVGGLVPVVIALSLATGFLIVTLAAALASVVYVVGTRLARRGQLPEWWPGVGPSATADWRRRRREGRAVPTPAPGRGATDPTVTGSPAPAGATDPTVTGSPVPAGATIPFGVPDGVTVPLGGIAEWAPPRPPYDDFAEDGGTDDDLARDRPWLDPPTGPAPDPSHLGVYPPPIQGPPPLGQRARPVPPPLTGPPPWAAPLAPRPPHPAAAPGSPAPPARDSPPRVPGPAPGSAALPAPDSAPDSTAPPAPGSTPDGPPEHPPA